MNPQIIDIAPLASGLMSNGHWYWVHKKFSEIPNAIVFSGKDSDAEYSIPILSGKYFHEHEPEQIVRADIEAIKENLKDTKSSIIFHIYEGNYQSVFLASELLKKYKNSIAVVNLHWAGQVASDFYIRDKSLEKFKYALVSLLIKHEGRLFLQAESEKLATFISRRINYNIAPYLVFSVFDIPEKNNFIRINDIQIATGGKRELLDAIEATKNLVASGLRVAINIAKYLYPNEISNSDIDFLKDLGYEIHISNLDERQYVEFLMKTKVVLLTYQGNFYQWGSSGRLLDAVRCGTRIVLPEGTALSEQVLKNGWGSTFDISSNKSLIGALELEILNSKSAKNYTRAPNFQDLINTLFELFKIKCNKAPNAVIRNSFNNYKVSIRSKKYLNSTYSINRSENTHSIN